MPEVNPCKSLFLRVSHETKLSLLVLVSIKSLIIYKLNYELNKLSVLIFSL